MVVRIALEGAKTKPSTCEIGIGPELEIETCLFWGAFRWNGKKADK